MCCPVLSQQVRGGPVSFCCTPRCPVPVCKCLVVHLGFPSRLSDQLQRLPAFWTCDGPLRVGRALRARAQHWACSGQRPSAGAPKRLGGHTLPWPWKWPDRRPAKLRGGLGSCPCQHSPVVSWPAEGTLPLHSALSACGEWSGVFLELSWWGLPTVPALHGRPERRVWLCVASVWPSHP